MNTESLVYTENIKAWLMRGDPAIRWQVLRDLEDADGTVVEAERRLIATTGWGARLLALQEPSSMWGGGLYNPKWISTTYTLLLLRDLGLTPENGNAAIAARLLQNRHPGRTHFEMENPGQPSRWITLRALRVIRWVENGRKKT